jgi:hypothetical protein
MTLTQPIINHIAENFKNNKFYIGDKIKALAPDFCNLLTKVVKCVDFKSADAVIDDQLFNFNKKIIITNIQNCFAKGYDLKIINKQQDIACYYRRPDVHNEHLICNPFELNNNPRLFELSSNNDKKVALNVKLLKDKYKGKKILIVGGGPSWQTLDYSKISDDFLIMTINYNFKINCDYMIYTDSSIADYLKDIKYHDNRNIIGFEERVDGQADYFFRVGDPFRRCLHTTAYALQIVDLMGFDEKYLIGCDYYRYPNGKDYCYKKLKNYTYRKSGGRIESFLNDFNKIKVKNVYQLNPASELTKYPLAEKEEIYGKN